MPEAKQTKIIPASPQVIYEIITDYKSYPQYMSGVDRVDIIQEKGSESLVEFTLSLIKPITYRLNMHHTPHNHVSWTLHSADIFKSNTGSWQLTDLGNGTTEVDYTVNIDFKLFVPKIIMRKLLEKQAPKLLNELEKRAETLRTSKT